MCIIKQIRHSARGAFLLPFCNLFPPFPSVEIYYNSVTIRLHSGYKIKHSPPPYQAHTHCIQLPRSCVQVPRSCIWGQMSCICPKMSCKLGILGPKTAQIQRKMGQIGGKIGDFVKNFNLKTNFLNKNRVKLLTFRAIYD